MTKQSLIIYKLPTFFIILNEIKENLSFELFNFSSNKDISKLNEQNFGNYLVLTNRKNKLETINSQLIIDKIPIKIEQLIERINIAFLKQNYSNQSNIKIGDYNLDINSREICKENKKLKLTEREINLILYLNSPNKNKSILDLQKNVWGHSSGLETHTVETHIYRLRKKITEIFQDSNFIISTKNGYKIL